MRSANENEKMMINKQVSNYLWFETLQTVMAGFVLLILSIGLFYNAVVESATGISSATFILLLISGLFFAVLVYVIYDSFNNLHSCKKILKDNSYTVEDCISREVKMKMNRSKKEVELVCKYEDNNGELSEKEYAILSNSKSLCAPDCEGKESLYVKFTDNVGFVYVK